MNSLKALSLSRYFFPCIRYLLLTSSGSMASIITATLTTHTHIYLTVDPTQSTVNDAIQQFEACLDELCQWMTRNFMKLNEGKTEFIVVGSNQHRPKVNITQIRDQISTSSLMRTSPWINTSPPVSRAACLSIRNLGLIREHVNQPVAAELFTHASITSRPDMGKSLLHGLNKSQVHRLERLQNTAAKLVTLSRKFTHITPILKQLHWLPIEQRIVFQICTLVVKTIHGASPTYLCNLVEPYVPARDNLRSAVKLLLVEHKAINLWGAQSFIVSAAKVWNALPNNIRVTATIDTFKTALKTHVFKMNLK